MIRSFDWRDFPRLHRYRHQGVWMDNELALTQRRVKVPLGALAAYLAPATGVFTYVAKGGPMEYGRKPTPIIGQFSHSLGSNCAKLLFLAPVFAINASAVPVLLDHMAVQSGNRGAHNLLADVSELSPAFEVLRSAGYAIFARQRVWRVLKLPARPAERSGWRLARTQDAAAIRSLYSALVPALAQQTEQPAWNKLNGFILWKEAALLAYVHVSFGSRGILAHPYIHPELENVDMHLASLLHYLPGTGNRPVYVTVRSYQGWLESPLEGLGAQPGPKQAVMVKRLAVAQKVDLSIKLPKTGLDTIQPEAS